MQVPVGMGLSPCKLLNCVWKRMGERNHLSQNHTEDVPAARMVEFLHCLVLFHLLLTIALSDNPIILCLSPQILLPDFCPHPNNSYQVSIQTSGSDCRVVRSL